MSGAVLTADDAIVVEDIAGAADPAPACLRKMLTRDADEQAENLRQWDQTYHQLTPGAFSGSLSEIWFGDIQLFREVTNQSVHEGGTAWPGSRTFGVPMKMDGPACYRGKAMNSDMLLTLGGGDELDFRTPRMLDIVGITVNSRMLDRFSRIVDGQDVESGLRRRHLIPLAAGEMAFLRAFVSGLFDIVDGCASLLAHGASRKAMQQAILGRLLEVVQKAGGEPAAGYSSFNRRQIVERAKAYVLSHPDETVTVVDLCALLHVSRRTLQYCFQEILGISPVQYLRAMRLGGARRDLKNGSAEEISVQDVAARWGFWHLSHFASDYRKMFGELPSDTLRANRARRKTARALRCGGHDSPRLSSSS